MRYLSILVICPFLLLFSCKEETNINRPTTLNRDYFFPVKEFEVPKVYVYKTEDKSTIDYLELSYNTEENELVLKDYSWNCTPIAYAKLKLTEHGAFLQESYEYGEEGMIIMSDVLKDSVHLWNATKPYSYALSFPLHGKIVHREVINELLGEEEIIYKGEKINTLKYKETYQFRNPNEEIGLTYFYLNYFAEGIGLVAYEWHRPGSKPDRFTLSKVIDMKAFGELVIAYESVREY